MSESPTVLLTLGRLPVALETARALSAHACRIVIADPWPLNLSRISNSVAASYRTVSPQRDAGRYLSEIDAIARRENATAIIPLSEETLFVSQLKGKTKGTVFCKDFQHTVTLHDKFTFVKLAQSIGLRVPATFASVSEIDVDCPMITKPRFSCGGRDVRHVESGQGLQFRPGDIAQKKIDGPELSVFCIAQHGVIQAMSCYRGTLRDGAVAIAFESIHDTSAVDWATAFVEKTQHTGFIAFDFIVDGDGNAWAIECNPRATSGIHLLSPDRLATALLDLPESSPPISAALKRMESYSCFTQAFAALLRRRNPGKVVAVLRSHTDVSWARHDPLPFLLMMVLNWRLIWHAIRRRESFARASVADIEWRPGDA